MSEQTSIETPKSVGGGVVVPTTASITVEKSPSPSSAVVPPVASKPSPSVIAPPKTKTSLPIPTRTPISSIKPPVAVAAPAKAAPPASKLSAPAKSAAVTKTVTKPSVSKVAPPASKSVAQTKAVSEIPLPSLSKAKETKVVASRGGGNEEEEEPSNEDDTEDNAYITPMYVQPQAMTIIAKVDFPDGYTVKQLLEYLKHAVTCTPLCFTRTGITIERDNDCDGVQTLISKAKFHADQLIDYFVHPEKCNDPTNGRHFINVDMTTLHGHVKPLTQKDGIRLIQYEEYPDHLALQPYGGTKTDGNQIFIKTEEFTNKDYDIDDGVTSEDMPNAKPLLSAFCTACKNMSQAKFANATLYVYAEGAHLIGKNATGSSSRDTKWGKCSVPERKSRFKVVNAPGPTVYTVNIPKDEIKCLTKMLHFNKSGVVQIYCKTNGMVRLKTMLGVCGEMTIHLLDPKAMKVEAGE